MQTLTTHEAKARFSEFIDHAKQAPVRVTRRGRVVGVMVSPEDYDAMRAFYAERLLRLRRAAAEHLAAIRRDGGTAGTYRSSLGAVAGG